jgi:hypothetical protein
MTRMAQMDTFFRARLIHQAPLALLVLILALGLPACSKSTAKKRSGKSNPAAMGANQGGPSARIVAPQHECKASPACLEAGFCTHDQGSCVVKSNQDCESASVCKRDGKCKATQGKCVAGDSTDCQQSSGCKHKGECVLQDGVCVGGKK